MQKNIGFIGAGNMGKAMISGLIKKNVFLAENIFVINQNPEKLKKLKNELHFQLANNLKELVEISDILVLAVKPNQMSAVLSKINTHLKSNVIIISVAAGITISQIETIIGNKQKIIRVIPNTPICVGEAMSSISPNSVVSDNDLHRVKMIFDSLGKSEIVSEELLHAVTGISGSSPAYVFILIEAMADAAVLNGMSRNQAYFFAAQAVLGAAKMVLETGFHPADLKDQVCSAGGTTIEAVCELENKGFRAAIISAIKSCVNKSKLLSQQ